MSASRLLPALTACLLALTSCTQSSTPVEREAMEGKRLVEVKTAYSTALVLEKGSVRSLYFLEPSGLAVRQTSIDMERPGRLLVPYTRTMFASFLFKNPQERVLIVGLGGGSMVRFLNHHLPQTQVDAVEIDPEIVKIAAEHFGTKPGRRTRIFTEDAFRYLERDHGTYDVIYMDAFLEPGSETDVRGIPKHLKTVRFLKSLQQKLSPGGVVAFNLVDHPGMNRDLRSISEAFPTVRVFRVPGTKNFSVIASPDPAAPSAELLRLRGRDLDRTLKTGFSFEGLVDLLEER
jgi:spermidine synthase